MLVYNWNFNPITVQAAVGEFENVVMTVHWQFYAQSGSLNPSGSFVPQYSNQIIGMENFTFDPSGSGFVPYNELTKDIVLGWVTGSIGAERVAQMSASLETMIAEQITPRIVNLPAPWV